jgi:hypothetical protein
VEILILLTPHIIEGDSLTTGYERDMGAQLDKTFQNYSGVTEGSDLSRDRLNLRAYQPYPALKPDEDASFTLKPLRSS